MSTRLAPPDSPYSSPPALTPDVTGSVDSSLSLSPTPHAGAPGLVIDTTGDSDTGASPSSDKGKRFSRGRASFYPHTNSSNKAEKPFSRSAAKRQSVMTLGSIEHLQHYFTKTGLQAKRDPSDKLTKNLVPAIGGLASMRIKASLGSLKEFDLPPSPIIPTSRHVAYPPVAKTYQIDPDEALPGVADDLNSVTSVWALPKHDAPSDATAAAAATAPIPSEPVDVLSTLKLTTRAIRSVRNYVLTLPDESAGALRSNYNNNYRGRNVGGGPPTLRRTASGGLAATGGGPPDPLTLIRKAALEVLSSLRELEERARLPLSDEAYDAQSDHGSSNASTGAGGAHPPSRGASPAGGFYDETAESDLRAVGIDPETTITFIRVEGRDGAIPVWDAPLEEMGGAASDLEDEEEERRRRRGEHWDDRLVLGGGWLYRQDVRLADLGREREVVRRYVGIVDDVLFGSGADKGAGEASSAKESKESESGMRGWQRASEKVLKKQKDSLGRAAGRRVSSTEGINEVFKFPPPPTRRVVSMGGVPPTAEMRGLVLSEEPEPLEEEHEDGEESVVDDEDLPEWAKRSMFANDALGRAHAFLQALLPADLAPHLAATASNREDFLQSLSSGQLLCVAYNAALRRSRKPWGYISVDSIHDIVALEADANANASGDGSSTSNSKGARTGWTFRRTDNLRLWAAALKLRYLLPVVVPPTPSASAQPPGTPRSGTTELSKTPVGSTPGSPTKARFSLGPGSVLLGSGLGSMKTSEPPIMFDPRVVARKEEGWADMLEQLLVRWMDAVVGERRCGP
ncbi:hypothetical protein CONPUDRAFT_139079 [Coniophora puteana RWD-64-598 SS2]|uniref:Uncharacterized protein n=1 Tax=Coniophora puteana (strain RWD-64-598) TaxID=741705 RepID=A0A5M3MH98_CONPW|nr:uncharacterized protein CONPUDRAFT_139079 [Coniophora puteana RWD-64-598 SS2]EIW78005.1 hypothetical protein CONPUDRAFT_139079 [Coniophora puteana RWD-64-598 SS2]